MTLKDELGKKLHIAGFSDRAIDIIKTIIAKDIEQIIGEDEVDEDEELHSLFYGTRNGLRQTQRQALKEYIGE